MNMIFTWNDVEMYIKNLSKQIGKTYECDVIIAVGRGAFVPSAMLAEILDVKNVIGVPTVHYRNDRTPMDFVNIAPIDLPIEEKRILLFDDILDTGMTMYEFKKYALKYKPLEVRTGVISLRSDKQQPEMPNYFAVKVKEWVIFPWELRDLEKFK